ncbi:MAG: aminotransferase class I/II-fold pyridoxal phosphate-dependent enzyme [Candidatus Symbiothrix sp.]|jgi:aspartate/methionine/tyrosine aminotransferase|nr:aminotransferase class I/II-fold pyridoxal phosphate-dependent enzyme [Candidatus Symbiothrix sp.]
MKTIEAAKRVNSVSEYYFSKKLKEIAEMNAQGLDVISLGVGSPDLPPPQAAIKVLCQAAQQADNHGYQPYVGIAELRCAFADWYRQWYRVELNPNTEIQPLIGSKEGILHISLAFLNAGDEVLAPNPGYPTYSAVSRLAEAKLRLYDLKEDTAWQPDLEALEQTDLSKVKLMWVNYPNMPTGAPATYELFQKLVDFGKRHGIVICNDNPYSFILNDHPLSILEIEGAKDVCIELNSMSKSHNMPGWRIAMLAANPQFVQWILRVKSNIDSGQFRPMMLAATKALKADPSWYDRMNSVYRSRRILAEQIMTALGCTFDPRQTGLFLWGKIPDSYSGSEQLSDETLYGSRVFITPGFIFGSNGERFVRISLCCNEERLKEAKSRIIKSL